MSNRKEEILIVALHLFARDGYEAVSVSQIAGELDMTKGALYRHYKSKRDIFDCIVQRMEQRDGEQAEEYDMPIEQFRSEEMQKLYQQYLVAGPASYVKALFESIGIVNAKDKAARFYAVMHFYYSLYDGAADKEKVKVEFVSAIKSLVQDLA